MNPEGVDHALESGNADKLVKGMTRHVEEGIRERFTRAAATKNQADTSVAAGREFVDRLHRDATTSAGHAAPPAPAEHKH